MIKFLAMWALILAVIVPLMFIMPQVFIPIGIIVMAIGVGCAR